MKNFYLKHYLPAVIIGMFLMTASLANAQNTIAVSGAGTAAVNGTYTYAGMSGSRPYYTNGIYRVEYRNRLGRMGNIEFNDTWVLWHFILWFVSKSVSPILTWNS